MTGSLAGGAAAGAAATGRRAGYYRQRPADFGRG